jgi:hypothetical protein
MEDFPCIEKAFESHMNIDGAMLRKAFTGHSKSLHRPGTILRVVIGLAERDTQRDM